jgi:hypothetical protein
MKAISLTRTTRAQISSKRTRQPTRKDLVPLQNLPANKFDLDLFNWSKACDMLKGGTLGAMWAELEQHMDQEHNTVKWINPALFSITWEEAMNRKNDKGY